MPAHLDAPAPAAPIDPLCFEVRGWMWLGAAQPEIAAIEAWCGDLRLGETRTLFSRPDVSAALALPANACTGFELFAHHPSAPSGGEIELRLCARRRDGSRTDPLLTRKTAPIRGDYRTGAFGVLLEQQTTAVQRRPNIYNEGPSVFGGSGEVLDLIRRYAGPPPRRLVDIGCGLGFYGQQLLHGGYDWLGVEVDEADCAELARRDLPHRRVDGHALPFDDHAFDAALCIEVLEHIDEPHAFLREIRRVAPGQIIVSVPNCELLGYLHDHLAVPWHMLEPDHKNFFTRWSLGALLREYYAEVEVRFHTRHPLTTVENTPLYYNLFAVGWNRA